MYLYLSIFDILVNTRRQSVNRQTCCVWLSNIYGVLIQYNLGGFYC